MADPYLPMEPVDAMLTGEYAKDVDVLIGQLFELTGFKKKT